MTIHIWINKHFRSLPDFENFVGVELSELKTVGAGAIRFGILAFLNSQLFI